MGWDPERCRLTVPSAFACRLRECWGERFLPRVSGWGYLEGRKAGMEAGTESSVQSRGVLGRRPTTGDRQPETDNRRPTTAREEHRSEAQKGCEDPAWGVATSSSLVAARCLWQCPHPPLGVPQPRAGPHTASQAPLYQEGAETRDLKGPAQGHTASPHGAPKPTLRPRGRTRFAVLLLTSVSPQRLAAPPPSAWTPVSSPSLAVAGAQLQ